MGLILLMEEMLYHLLSTKLYEKWRNSPYQLVIAGYLPSTVFLKSTFIVTKNSGLDLWVLCVNMLTIVPGSPTPTIG